MTEPVGARSTHDRFRSRLALLADDAFVSTLVGPGERSYGRFHPDRPVWATLVIERADGAGPRRLDVADEPVAGMSPHGELGWIATSDPIDDPDLPGLGRVLGSLDHARIVRYRPSQRCTLRGSTAAGERFVKVGGLTRQEFADQQALYEAAERGEIDVAVARPDHFDEAGGALWQGVVPGKPIVDVLLGPTGIDLARRLGTSLGLLASSSLPASVVDDDARQLARTRRAAKRLRVRVPALADDVAAIVAELESRHDALAARRPVPVHGSPHMHQWLLDGVRLGLIDFDRLSMGDPELDIATLVAELETETGLVHRPDDIEAAVVAGVESTGVVLDPQRLRLYRLHKRLAKATRSAWALRPDGDEVAARHLARVANSLASL